MALIHVSIHIHGNFDVTSKTSTESEAQYIYNSRDINAHLTKQEKEKVISDYVETSKHKISKQLYSFTNYYLYTNGGIFVTLEASIDIFVTPPTHPPPINVSL